MLRSYRAERRKRRGFTLTEVAIVLGAMGLIMSVVWTVADTVWVGYRYTKMNEELFAIVHNIRDHFGPKGRIQFADGDITANLDNDNFRLIPISMRASPAVAGGAINHALGGQAGGSLSVEQMNAGKTFRIIIRQLNRTNCVKLLTQFPVMMPEMGVIRLDGNGAALAFDPRNPAAMPAGLPLTPNVAMATYCALGGKLNVVSYDFRLFP